MPSKAITDAFVRNVRLPRKDSEQKQVSYFDTLERGLALVLVASYGGTKRFRVMTYDANGKARSQKLGTYPPMTVKEARAAARAFRENPAKFNAQAKVGTFKEVAQNWIKRHVEAKHLRSQPEIERILAKYMFPRWGDRPFLEIRRREVNELLDNIADNHGCAQADQVLALIRGVMVWFQARDENYTSPIVKGMRRNADRKARDRILKDEELRAVWKAAEDSGSFGSIVKLCLLTAQRRKKIGTMKWTDIEDGVWIIPAESREKGTAGTLRLPKAALDSIDRQPQIAGNAYVFASGAAKHFNNWSGCKQELDEKLPDMPPWVIHDLRRTARSLMSRAGVRPDVAERVLGHVIPGVEGVYDRHPYADEKADALKRLAALVETIVNPPKDNVVAIAPRRARKRR